MSSRMRILAGSCHQRRAYCARATAGALRHVAIGFSHHGQPGEVLRAFELDTPSALSPNEVRLRVMAAPINPSDINAIQGTYPILPSFTHSTTSRPGAQAIAGNEGVAVVEETGSAVSELSVGDKVIPALAASGTWRSTMVAKESDVLRLPADTDTLTAATISVNPCTAFRMIRDFAEWQTGERSMIVQNAGNSGVGQAVIQLAAAWKIPTINVVRDRPDFDQVGEYLRSLGADHVVREQDVRKQVPAIIKSRNATIKLALNGVGGKSATELARLLSPDASMVTYGGMSREPVTIPTSLFIFKNIRCQGFWMAEWNQRHMRAEREAMLAEIVALAQQGLFRPPAATMIELALDRDDQALTEQVLAAVQAAGSSFSGRKQVLTFK
ncbi:mitochondrial 2-enoyl thioester reductase [Sorochytrium milnesiophthora]